MSQNNGNNTTSLRLKTGLAEMLKGGVITPQDRAAKENLRTMFAVSPDDYTAIESRLLRENNGETKTR